jgi:hypothetical protein
VAAQIALEYERVYNAIYGSQIAALRLFKDSPDGLRKEQLQEHVTRVKETFAFVAWVQTLTFNGWIGFLLIKLLVENPPPDSNVYKITPKGSGFLDYIDTAKYPLKMF